MELAAAALQTVLGEVIKVVGREAQCALGFKGEFADMQRMLVRATELHADKVNLKDKDPVTRVALIQLREVVYKADDILMDCLFRYEDVEGHWIRRSNLRITEPSFLSKTSKKLTEINKQLGERMEFLNKLPDNKTQTKHEEPIVKPQTRNVDVVIGFESDIDKIKGWICEEDKKLQRIAIWGMGGLGKTTIVRQIYNDKQVYQRFDEIIWVTVSKNFNKTRILEEMLKKLGGAGSEDSSDFMTKIKEKLENKTCLVVFDDVWKIDEMTWWSDLCAVLTSTVSGRSSCIITTTRSKGVADVVVDEDRRIHRPNTLDDKNSWLLFSRLAFPSSGGNCRKPQLDEIGKEIVKKCRGLPLAIKAIAPLMSSKTTMAEWTAVQQSYVVLENERAKIKGWIFQTKKKLQRIAIVGNGETTIAPQIYDDDEVYERFDERIWVTVSKNFNKDRILEDMLKKLGGTGSEDRSDFMTKIKEKLKNKTCLVVFDDVWRIDEKPWWSDLFALLTSTVSDRSSCIITTTRSEEVADVVVDEDKRIYRSNTLDARNSWLLFSRLAFKEGNCRKPPLKEIGKEIVKKCWGHPQSIKTIANLMSSKTTSAEWTAVEESYDKSLFEREDDEGKDHEVITSLKWSYFELPALLKQCLLCFSVYPEDFEIRAEQLIHWWIAEGLVQQRKQKSAFEVGYECLLGLTSRCLVEVVECRDFDGRVSSCKLHDIVRDLIIQTAEEEGFCSFNQQQGTQVWKNDSYWLAFNYEKDKKDEQYETVLIENSKLRALLLKVKSPVGRIFVSSLPSLRMLDISGSKLNKKDVKDLLVWIRALKRLASLNLSNVEGLEELPSSISELLNLQILILSGCTKLKKIPNSITRLKKLIVLKVGGCSSLEYLPRGLEKLSNLQELTGFKVANQTKTKGCELTELRNLTNLRVLRIVIRDEAVEVSGIELNKILSELEELKILEINANECEKEQVWKMVDSLTPPPNLLELYLCNYDGKMLPKWFCPSKLSKLQYLSIENGDIVNMNSEAENGSSDCKWKFLEGLCLKQLPRLEVEWKDLKEGIMPALRYLEVSRCSNLGNKNFPCSVEKPGVWREQ